MVAANMVVSIFYFLQRFNNPLTPRRYSHETRSNQNIHGTGQHPGRNDYLHVKKQQHPFLQKGPWKWRDHEHLRRKLQSRNRYLCCGYRCGSCSRNTGRHGTNRQLSHTKNHTIQPISPTVHLQPL